MLRTRSGDDRQKFNYYSTRFLTGTRESTAHVGLGGISREMRFRQEVEMACLVVHILDPPLRHQVLLKLLGELHGQCTTCFTMLGADSPAMNVLWYIGDYLPL